MFCCLNKCWQLLTLLVASCVTMLNNIVDTLEQSGQQETAEFNACLHQPRTARLCVLTRAVLLNNIVSLEGTELQQFHKSSYIVNL